MSMDQLFGGPADWTQSLEYALGISKSRQTEIRLIILDRLREAKNIAEALRLIASTDQLTELERTYATYKWSLTYMQETSAQMLQGPLGKGLRDLFGGGRGLGR